jgi:hypothetical protein
LSAKSATKLLTRLTAILATTAADGDMIVVQNQVNTS